MALQIRLTRADLLPIVAAACVAWGIGVEHVHATSEPTPSLEAPSEAQRAVIRAAAGAPSRKRHVPGVLEWLPSVGGDKWFDNYLKTYGPPQTKCVVKFQGDDVSAASLGHYYLRHPVRGGRLVVEPECFVLATDAVPVDELAKRNPTIVAQKALVNWDAYLVTGADRYRARFLEHADALLATQQDGRWDWRIDIPTRGLKAPWISGLTQSQGISVLLRAHQLTGEVAYLDAATVALKWLHKPLARGGVAIRTPAGIWYEEYPNAEQPSHVLNGHIWALFGIWDYFRVTRDPKAARMFRRGVDLLKTEIANFDVGYWVVYDQLNRVDMVNGFYMNFIIEQLKALHAITGDTAFERLARKWTGYQQRHTLFARMAFDEYRKATEAKSDKRQ
jgi:hypothetical protein